MPRREHVALRCPPFGLNKAATNKPRQRISVKMDFADLGLTPDTLKAVIDAGYLTPTPIQEQAIPVVLMGRDVLGVAQTGTGKTAAFTMPMIDILSDGRAKARMPRSLIIAPTRELAAQISDNFVKYGKYQSLSMALLIGGSSFTDQEKALERGVDVLIATPGRLLDLYERGRILLNDVKVLVIDEADRMLDMGFIPDVDRIVALLPKIRQTLFFSATMNKEIRKLADKFLLNPKEIAVSMPATAAATIEQGLVTVRNDDKREALRRILRAKDIHNAFIFCNRKKDVDILHKSLTNHGFDTVALHGDMPQSTRNETLAKFKAGEAELLVCSDVAARGLDISNVGHVINFDVPVNAEDYIHRIGRTGRAGKVGHAYTLSSPADAKLLVAVEKMLKHAIPPLQIDELAEFTIGAAEADSGKKSGGRERGKPRGARTRTPRAKKETPRTEDEPSVTSPTSAPPPEPEAAMAEASQSELAAPEATSSDSTPEQTPPDKQEPKKPKASARNSRDDDRRGPNERARRTRRNPHGIAEMNIEDDVVAFGGFTPEFLEDAPYRAAELESSQHEHAEDELDK
jgi:superfamily II DNA/RNA helicase